MENVTTIIFNYFFNSSFTNYFTQNKVSKKGLVIE